MARSASASSPLTTPASHRNIWLALAVFVVTLLAYLPALKGGFIWNDSDYVTAPELRTTEGFWRIWFELGATEQYYPFLHSAFWLQQKLWGDSAAGYHLVNILLHALSACLLAANLRRLDIPGAGLAAFVFALHPVYVESVAWISEQKNTLSLVFYLLAARIYLGFDAERRPRLYVVATVLFIIGLLTKSVIATLPGALLVVFWWRRGRLDGRRDVVPLLPWLGLGAMMGLLSAYVEKVYIGAQGSEFALTFVERCLLAGRVVWFYVGKLIWPADLIFIYPRWKLDTGEFWQWLFPMAVIAALAVLWILRRRSRAPLAAALFFGGSLFPTLGFFNVYAFIYSFVADHWQYLPSIGIVVLGSAGLTAGLQQLKSGRVTMMARREPAAERLALGPRFSTPPRWCAAIPVLMIMGLGVLTFLQSRMYADMRTFYATTLARNAGAWMAHNNLGNMLRNAGELDLARMHFEAALRVRPDLEKVHNNLANVLREQKRYEDALAHYRQALDLKPNYAEAHNNYGSLLRQLGRPADAIKHLLRALQTDPGYSDARNNLGMALRDAGRLDDAISQFERLVHDTPGMAAAHLNLALTLSLVGRTTEAMAHYREARELNPAIPELPAN